MIAAESRAARDALLATLTGVALVSGFAFLVVEPFIALYFVLAAGLAGLVLAMRDRRARLLTLPGAALLAAIVLLCVPLPFVWQTADDLLGVIIVLPLLIAPGIGWLVLRDERWPHPLVMPTLCLLGTLGALGGGLFEHYVLGAIRVGMGNNPIHFAGMAVIVGFLGLTGVAATRSPWRFLYLLAPAAALWVAVLSGSRGPMLAWLALAGVSLPLMLIWFWRDLVFLALLAASLVGLTYAYFSFEGSSRAATVLASVQSILEGGTLTRSDDVRMLLYETAYEQFQASPIVGHGASRLMELAGPRLAAAQYPPLENLHSDIANFAVVAGVFGLIAYGLIILAPLTLFRASRPVAFGAIVLSLGYVALGLTNAMFGVLAQTVLYALVLGVLLAQARAAQAVRASSMA